MSQNSKKTTNERIQLFNKAIQAHRKYTTAVLNFETFDRHLLGLKLTALENGYKLPELFQDEAFKRITHYHLSSSQVNDIFKKIE